MTKELFIKKWNVGYESKEQQIEFANEMKADLDGLVELHPSITHINAKNLKSETVKMINKMVEKVNEISPKYGWHPIEFAGTWSIHDMPFYEGKNLLSADDVGCDQAKANAILAASAPELESKVTHLTAENTRLREALEGFIKIRHLIEYKEPIKEKHYGEAQAIWNAINKAEQALK